MRVLQVEKFLHRQGGGASAYALDLTDLQRADGDEVAVFGMADDRNVPNPYAADLAPHVELEPPPPGAAARLVGAARLVWSRRAEAAMARVVADFRPDVAHLHNIYHQLTPSILRPLVAARVPVVMTLHDYKLVCPTYRLIDTSGPCTACLDNRFRHAVERRCAGGSRARSALLATETRLHRSRGSYDGVGAFVCPSSFLLETVRRTGAFDGRLHHVPHFVDLSTVPARVGAGDGFVYTGRLSPEKGVDDLVRAVGRLPAARLTVVGDGPERASLEALAGAVAPDRVTFTGHLPREEVLGRIRGARAVVLAARWYENQPMSVLEALGSGVPAVVTDLGGCPELVEDGVTGRVVTAGDIDALAAALRDLEAGPDGATALGRAGRRYVRTSFDPQLHLAALRRVYAAATARVGS